VLKDRRVYDVLEVAVARYATGCVGDAWAVAAGAVPELTGDQRFAHVGRNRNLQCWAAVAAAAVDRQQVAASGTAACVHPRSYRMG
jgi:hypothetical protein